MLLLYALARPLPSPISAAFVDGTFLSTRAGPDASCGDIRSCRTTEEILYSCFAVVFACTWVAIHPNIPRNFKYYYDQAKHFHAIEVSDSFGVHPAVVTLQDLLFMILALTAPELIIMWAMRQWFAARNIAKKYQEQYGWTKTHGFFLIMGGFVLYDGEKFLRTLSDNEWFTEDDRRFAINIDGLLEREFIQGYLEGEGEKQPVFTEGSNEDATVAYHLPTASCLLQLLLQKKLITITPDEIEDRGKSDGFSKVIATGQTLWFIAQCIARGREGISVTNLEILALAFALLNFATYFFWWNKPQRVRFPFKIHCSNHGTERKDSPEAGKASCAEEGGEHVEVGNAKKQREGEKCETNSRKGRALLHPVWNGLKAISRKVVSDWEWVNKDAFDQLFNMPRWLIFIPLRIILYPVFTLMTQCLRLVMGTSHYQTGLKKDPFRLYASIIVVGVAFGAIHCIPWAFTFPSHTEKIIWRICALVVTCGPIILIVILPVLDLVDQKPHWAQILSTLVLFVLPSIIYAIGRLTLVVLALMELRALQPSAYQTVEWTTLIPHI